MFVLLLRRGFGRTRKIRGVSWASTFVPPANELPFEQRLAAWRLDGKSVFYSSTTGNQVGNFYCCCSWGEENGSQKECPHMCL